MGTSVNLFGGKKKNSLRNFFCAFDVSNQLPPRARRWCCVVSVFTTCHSGVFCGWHVLLPCPHVWPCRLHKPSCCISPTWQSWCCLNIIAQPGPMAPKASALTAARAHVCLRNAQYTCFMMQGSHAFSLNMRTAAERRPSKSEFLRHRKGPGMLPPPRRGVRSGLMYHQQPLLTFSPGLWGSGVWVYVLSLYCTRVIRPPWHPSLNSQSRSIQTTFFSPSLNVEVVKKTSVLLCHTQSIEETPVAHLSVTEAVRHFFYLCRCFTWRNTPQHISSARKRN